MARLYGDYGQAKLSYPSSIDIELPYVVAENAPAYGGRILVTAVMWSWIQPNGKRHDRMLVPQIEYMLEIFQKYFVVAEHIEYANGYYGGIIARKTKS